MDHSVKYRHLDRSVKKNYSSFEMGRPREFDTETTLAKVREEFWRHGYAATSLDRLMEATNLGKGSLYTAFGDKRALFLRVLTDYAAASVAAMRDLHGAPRAIDALRATLRPMFGDRGCFLSNCTVELSPQDAEVVALARTTFAALETIMTETVRRAMREGDLPEETRPRELAAVILAAAKGLEFLGRTGVDAATIERVGRNAARELLGEDGRGSRPRRRSKGSGETRGSHELDRRRRSRIMRSPRPTPCASAPGECVA